MDAYTKPYLSLGLPQFVLKRAMDAYMNPYLSLFFHSLYWERAMDAEMKPYLSLGLPQFVLEESDGCLHEAIPQPWSSTVFTGRERWMPT